MDSSVSIKWFLRDEDLVEAADAIRGQANSAAVRIVAPSLSRYEVARALATASRRGRIEGSRAARCLRDYLLTGVSLDADPGWLVEMALSRSLDLGIAVYDAVYVTLAQELDLELVTADAKLFNAVSEKVPLMQWLGHLTP